MKKHFLTLIAIATFTTVSLAQVGVNSDNSAPNPSAQLDIKSTDKGLLIPRLTTLERNAIQNPEIGLMVFDKDLQEIFIYNSDGWKQGTLSKLPLILSSGNFNNIFKVINTKSDSYPNGSTAAEFINNDILGTAISAKNYGNSVTVDIRNSSGPAFYGESGGASIAGQFSSSNGVGILTSTNDSHSISGINNSNNYSTAKFTNNGTGPALELNSGLKIVATKPAGIEVEYSNHTIAGPPDSDAGIRVKQTGFYGMAIYASSDGISPTIAAKSNGPSSPAISGISTHSDGGNFSSTNGIGLVSSASNQHGLYVLNNSITNPTAKIYNFGSGPAMELNSDLNITTNNQTGLSLTSNYPASTFQERVGALTINHTGLYGNGIVAISKYGVALTGIGTESGGSGIRGLATNGDGGYFHSENGRAISGTSSNYISIHMSNSSLNYPTAKFQNFTSGGLSLELTGDIEINGKINQEAYQTPYFQNNWNNFGGEWNTAKFYKGKDSRVYLEGVVNGGSSNVIFTLPVGYRPASRIFFIVSHNGGSRGRIDIASNGEVRFEFGNDNTQVGLDGISFRVE